MLEEKEPVNIWGQEGCQLPDGEHQCVACCEVYGVGWLNKEPGVACTYQDLPEGGCLLHPENHPLDQELADLREKYCGPFHCSSDKTMERAKNLTDGPVPAPNRQRLEFIENERKAGRVSDEQAGEAVARFF